MKKWIAIYKKDFPSLNNPIFDPFAFECYGWEIEAENPSQALEKLEQSPDVPFRIFLTEVIASENLAEWNEQSEPRHRVKLVRRKEQN